ncbi:MAG: hypothetical protein RR218_05285 [Gordonibacter sp.]
MARREKGMTAALWGTCCVISLMVDPLGAWITVKLFCLPSAVPAPEK